jgi:RHS repeat-associated protein
MNVVLNSGFQRLTTAAREYGQDVAHELLTLSTTITEPGYVYIYLSNENSTPVEVYFDDFKVDHVKGAIVQMDDYYPFGLTFNSYSRENSVENRYLYNQGTGEKTFKTERVYDLGLNVDQSKYRTYDYITGRWWQIDPKADEGDLVSLTPYNYSYNNPILYNDPEGDCPMCVGALVGALVDTGLQLAEIALDDNKTLSDFSFTSVAVSAASGAVGVGIATKVDKALKVANLAGKAASAIKVASGAATDAATSTASQLATKGEVNAKEVLIDVVAGCTAGKVAGDVAEKAAKNTPAGKVLTRQADRAERVAG